jgi:hypothetical protein
MKTLSGSAAAYGDTLPNNADSYDGALYYKTISDSQPTGLYLYGFVQDLLPSTPGSQVGQAWQRVGLSPADLVGVYVAIAGDTMTGPLSVPNLLSLTAATGEQRLLIGNKDSGGLNKPAIISGQNGIVSIGQGNSWVGNGGTLTNGLVIDASSDTGLTFRSNQVWHSANDGAASGLDADLLDGQHGAFYQNAGNLNAGTVPSGRLAGTYSISISGSASQLNGQLASFYQNADNLTSGVVPAARLSGSYGISISGNAGTATLATDAVKLQTARTITLAGDLAGSVAFNGSSDVTLTATVNSSSLAGYVQKAGDTMTGVLISSNATNSTSTSTGAVILTGGMAVGGNIYSGGDVSAAGDVIFGASDVRLKKNIKRIENALDKVSSLTGVEYDWDVEVCQSAGYKPSRTHEHGLIAQDVQMVAPDMVAPTAFNPDYITVRYERLTSLLVEAVKELSAQVQELKKKMGE